MFHQNLFVEFCSFQFALYRKYSKMLRLVKPKSGLSTGLTRGLLATTNSGCSRGIRTTVMSCGDGSHGALGLPSSVMGLGSDSYEPTPIQGLPDNISSIAAGHYHSLAVTSDGHVWSWGRNHESQLGRHPLSPRSYVENFVERRGMNLRK